jgi:hypothetical protein
MDKCAGFGLLLTIPGVALSLVPFQSAADEYDVAVIQKYTPTGRHRLDLSYTRYDTFAGEVDMFLPSYTWAPWQNLRLDITGSVVANNSGDADETGIGDTSIGIQYDPSASLTASPWVPDTVGLFGQVIAPTGDADQGLSADTWFASLGTGWAIDTISHLWLIPAFGYEFTFNEGASAASVNQPYASMDFIWVFDSGAWFGVTPKLGYEFEEEEWVDQYLVTIGKMYPSGFGAGLSYGRIEQLNPNANRDDQTWLLNFYYQFGKPPAAPVE